MSGTRSRTWALTSAALTLALVAAGCGSDEPELETSPDAGSTTDGEAVPEHEGTVVFAGFGSGFQETIEEHVIPTFEKETGIDVVYVPGTAATNLAEIQASAGAPSVDVYWASQVTHQQGLDNDLFDPLDPALVPNLENVFEDARLPDDVGVVMGRYAVGLEYNPAAYEEAGLEPPTSWNDLWSDELAGHVGLYGFDIGYTQVALPTMAEALGGSIDDMAPLWGALSEVEITALADTPATLNTLIQQGEVWLTFNSNSRVNELVDAGMEVEFVSPEEGAVAFDNIFDLVKDAQHPVAAQMFIDFALEELAQLAVAEGLSMAPVIPDMEMSEELLTRTGYNPDEAARVPVIVPDIPVILENLEDWSAEWQNALG